MAALPACRAADVHNVLPVLASTLKYCPLLRLDSPKSTVPTSTLLLKRYGTSAFSHTSSVTHWLFCFFTVKAIVGPPFPDTISVCPKRTGVTAFVKFELTYGRSQSSIPVAGSTPPILPWVIVT